MTLLLAIWSILLALAPWMLLGMAIAGALHVMLPANFVHRHLGGRWGVVKAVLLGVPLPLCSCGVIPAGLGLKRDGASNGSAVGFLISTPQTGVDSMLVSASFLGWPFAVFKLVSATVTGLVGGFLTDALGSSEGAVPNDSTATSRADRSIGAAVDHAVEILRSIWRWVVFGVVVSALIEVFVPADFFADWAGRGQLLPILAVLLVSVPLYVCATASVPIAAALVASGMPAGAALVFLIAGPATNVATMGAIFRGLGPRVLAIYLTVIVSGSVAFGLVFDSLLESGTGTLQHEHGPGWWAVLSAVVFVAMLAWFAGEELWRVVRRQIGTASAATPIELGIDGMKCAGCVAKLERALSAESGVESAVVTLKPGRAVILGPIDEDQVRHVVERLGFQVAPPGLKA